jgi:serine protease
MKNKIRSLFRIFIITTVFVAVVSALAHYPAGAESDSSETLDLRAQNESAGLPTNQMIVKYKTSTDLSGSNAPAGNHRLQMLRAASAISLEYFRAMSGNAHVYRLPSRLSLAAIEEIGARLAELPDVQYAEPDRIMLPALAPTDPQYGSQWHYFEAYGINAPAAWDITTGSTGIRVAVIDTGITDHADLSGRWVGGYDFIANVPTANDGNGRDSDPHDPGDWITQAEASSAPFLGCPVINSTWHGTHVTGTIGAGSNNGTGVAGVNWVSNIVPVRVLGKCGGFTSDVADGMRWAAGLTVNGVPANPNPVKVLNLSLGGPGVCSSTYQNAIDAINAAGSVVVVAAGNNGSNLNTNSFQPANCNGVITVAATDREGQKAYYSNYGATVEISAPGGETVPTQQNGVLSTLNAGTTFPGADAYGYKAGTSMAAPHVSGVISLMLSLDPALNPTQILQILQTTARPFLSGGSCNTSICGSGIVDAGSALNAIGLPDPPGAFDKSSPSNGATNQSTSPTLQWGSSNGATSYEYCYDTTSGCINWASVGMNTSVALSGLSNNQTYYWQVRGVNAGGNTLANTGTYWSFTTAASPICYPLSLSHTGQGSDPVASPGNSTGCPVGQYVVGATIHLSSAVPASGWYIGGWNGTNDNSSTASTNTVTMPAGVHPASVIYMNIAPIVLSITRADGNPTSAANVDFTVTFSEAVLGVDVTDFKLTKTGSISGYAVTGISPATGPSDTYTVSVTTGEYNGTLRLDVVDDDSIKDGDDHPLGGVGSGNGDFISGEAYTVNKKFSSNLKSLATQDGWLLESGEATNKGGTLNKTAITFLLGDNAQKNQYRSVLSFRTKGLPDNAIITKITLKLKKQGVLGGEDPVKIFQGFMIDVMKGFFGASAGLQVSDFQAKANKSYGPFEPILASGWYTINLTPAKAHINKLVMSGGVTQMRLRFKLDDNNNNIANDLKLYSGNAPAASRPQLIIEYYVP